MLYLCIFLFLRMKYGKRAQKTPSHGTGPWRVLSHGRGGGLRARELHRTRRRTNIILTDDVCPECLASQSKILLQSHVVWVVPPAMGGITHIFSRVIRVLNLSPTLPFHPPPSPSSPSPLPCDLVKRDGSANLTWHVRMFTTCCPGNYFAEYYARQKIASVIFSNPRLAATSL